MGRRKATVEKRGPGRPQIGPEPLTRTLQIRVSDPDARELATVAQEHGVSVSQWVRQAILQLLR